MKPEGNTHANDTRAKRRMQTPLRLGLLVAITAAMAGGCGGGSGGGGDGTSDPQLAVGESQDVFGGTVSVWARFAEDGSVEAAGMTLPFAAIENAPADEGADQGGGAHDHHGGGHATVSHDQPSGGDGPGGHEHGSGDGPAGAVAVLSFPDAVREQTVLDHLELHWNPSGHEPETIYSFPHYDFHFYTVPESEVLAVDCLDPVQPSADRVPPGYALPPGCVTEMGQHAIDPSSPEYAPVNPKFTRTFLIGFWNGKLTFLEPMITREYLLGRPDFSWDIPVPAVLGRSTLYPTRFIATYDPAAEAYEMVFTDFVAVQ